MSQDSLWTLWGIYQEFLKTFPGLSKDFLITFSRLCCDFHNFLGFSRLRSHEFLQFQWTFSGLSENFLKTFQDFLKNFLGLSQDIRVGHLLPLPRITFKLQLVKAKMLHKWNKHLHTRGISIAPLEAAQCWMVVSKTAQQPRFPQVQPQPLT